MFCLQQWEENIILSILVPPWVFFNIFSLKNVRNSSIFLFWMKKIHKLFKYCTNFAKLSFLPTALAWNIGSLRIRKKRTHETTHSLPLEFYFTKKRRFMNFLNLLFHKWKSLTLLRRLINDSNNIRRRLQPEHFKIWKQAESETVLLHDWKPIYENSRGEMENWTSLR